jgi:hypothetical protein
MLNINLNQIKSFNNYSIEKVLHKTNYMSFNDEKN